MYTLYLWCFILFTSCFKSTSAEQVMYPIKEGNDTGLVIMAGAYLFGEQYDAVGLAIQEAFPGRLWVYLDTIESENDTYIYNTEPRNLNNTQVGRARLALYEAGMSKDAPYYAMGHSLGGILIYLEVKFSREDLADGVILLGATMYDHSFDSYPVPVQVINGDLDGMQRVTGDAVDFRDMYDAVKAGDDTYKYRYPHVMVDGMNHGMYLTGELPDNVILYWTVPEITVEESLQHIATAVTTFFIYQLTTDDGMRNEAIARMDVYFDEMDHFVQPFYPVLDLQYNVTNNESPWARMGQSMIADLEEGDGELLNVTNYLLTREQIAVNVPSINNSGDSIDVVTYTSVYFDGFITAVSLDTKYKSSQAIKEVITGQDQEPEPDVFCRDVDQSAWNLVYDNFISEKTIERYMRRNITVTFLDDASRDTSLAWLTSNPLFYYNGTHLYIRSVHYISETADGVETSGMHHCKLLSPARVQEFIYSDALMEYLYFPPE